MHDRPRPRSWALKVLPPEVIKISVPLFTSVIPVARLQINGIRSLVDLGGPNRPCPPCDGPLGLGVLDPLMDNDGEGLQVLIDRDEDFILDGGMVGFVGVESGEGADLREGLGGVFGR